jgi:drug/metabolite transporter (DMT)-like permease
MQATIHSNTITQGVIAATLASAIWGGMYVISRVVLEMIPPITLVCIRMAVSSLFILGLLVVRGQNWRLPKEIWGRVLAMGLIGNALSITAQFQGTHLAGAALGSLITTASPLVTVALSAAFGLEKIPLRAWIGLGLGLLGVYALSASSGSSGASLAGIAWLVLAAVSWGVLGLIGGQAVAKHDALLVTAWASAIACVTTALFIPWETSSHPIGQITPGVIVGVAYIGIVSTAIAFSAWVFGVSRAGSVLSGIAFFAQPVVGGLLGWALLGEQLGPVFGLAAGLLFCGAMLARPDKRGENQTLKGSNLEVDQV